MSDPRPLACQLADDIREILDVSAPRFEWTGEQLVKRGWVRASPCPAPPSEPPKGHAPDCSAVVFAPGAKGQEWEPACDCGASSSVQGPFTNEPYVAPGEFARLREAAQRVVTLWQQFKGVPENAPLEYLECLPSEGDWLDALDELGALLTQGGET